MLFALHMGPSAGTHHDLRDLRDWRAVIDRTRDAEPASVLARAITPRTPLPNGFQHALQPRIVDEPEPKRDRIL